MPSEVEEESSAAVAFTNTYTRYASGLLGYLLVRTKREPDAEALAEDVAADTWLRAWIAWERFEGTNRQGWLYRIALRRLIDVLRHRRTVPMEAFDPPAPFVSSDPDPLQAALDSERATEVRRLLTLLPASGVRMMTLRFYEDLSYKEIGQITHRPPNAVKAVLYRARHTLRQTLRAEQRA